jgi:hypothetical protein
LIPFAATVLRSLALLRYRSRASSHNDFTPLTRLSRALRLRFAFPGSSLERAERVFAEGTGGSPVVDVKALHAKIGELTLENDFLESALIKAGMLSARR